MSAAATGPTTTLEVETIDRLGGRVPIFHGAFCSPADALNAISRFAVAPVNPANRSRIVNARGGRVQIGQTTATLAVLG
jgi:hypothetical protein